MKPKYLLALFKPSAGPYTKPVKFSSCHFFFLTQVGEIKLY